MNIQLRDRLAQADPAAGLFGYAAAEADRIVDAIVGEHPAYRGMDGRRAGRPGRRSVAVAGALAATVTAILLTQQLAPGGASDAARRVLVQAAAQASDPPARADQWWQVTRTGYWPDGTIERRIEFVAVDGSRPTVFVDESFPPGVGSSPSQRSAWSTGLSPNVTGGAWQVPDATFMAGLPRDVDALRARLYADTAGRGRSVDGEAVVYVADLLRSGIVPADLRRSLYAVLQTVPGVDLAAPQSVAGTRTGVVIAYTETAGLLPTGAERQELLLDPATGELLAERTVRPGSEPSGWTTIERAVVDAVPDDVRAAEVVLSCRALDGAGGVQCQRSPSWVGPPGPSSPGTTSSATVEATKSP